MYVLQVVTRDSLLKVTLDARIDGTELRKLLVEIERSRELFSSGYKLWIVLPAGLRQVRFDTAGKLDLTVYSGKVEGLKQVVIEAPQDNSGTGNAVQLMKSIYQSMNVPINVVCDEIEARKSLGLLWRQT